MEEAYQRYSHRQRQKSLILANIFDLILKIIIVLKVIYAMYILCIHVYRVRTMEVTLHVYMYTIADTGGKAGDVPPEFCPP